MLRTAAGLRQRDVAERLGVGTSSVARLEAEDVNPRLNTLLRYLDAIGRSLEDFAHAVRASESDEPHLPAGKGLSEPGDDLTWVVRELLEMRREQAALAREFDRFRDAVTMKVLDYGTDSSVEPATGRREKSDPGSSGDGPPRRRP